MPNGNILIVDDNKSVLSALDVLLSPEFDKVQCISNPNLLIAELQKTHYHLVLLDMNFKSGICNGNEGIYWLNQIKEKYPDISVVMITAYGDVELAVQALKTGATDFVLKPWENSRLLATVRSSVQLNLSREEVKELRDNEKELKKVINREKQYIIGNSAELMQVLKVVDKVAKTDTNVLITGENGTGKELIAQQIHALSSRNQDLLVTVDMGAVTETLFESELFGHVKGAFTDAHENRIGKFELANKGTLFLDEIGNLSLNLQAKLLVALQNRQITRVGSNHSIAIDIRLICATNRNLHEMVERGQFREDLLYRMNTIQIEVPPLRNRGNDILVLANFFLTKYASKYNKPSLTISDQAAEKLLKYSWPGNIRELEHSIEKAVILSEKNRLKAEDFFLKPMSGIKTDPATLKIDEMEAQLISIALERNQGNISAAADQLGITRQTLYNKMKKLGLS